MTTANRTNINSPANGLLVFDTSTKSVWFYESTTTSWKEIYGSNNNTTLADTDGDTRIEVEATPDNDEIRFYNDGQLYYTFTKDRLIMHTQSTLIGLEAGSNTTSYGNTAIGQYALNTNVGSTYSTAIGDEAMRYAYDGVNEVGAYNVAVGYRSLRGSTTAGNNHGTLNTAIGSFSMHNNTSGYWNTALGYGSLVENTSGKQNIAIGNSSLLWTTSGSYNIAVGNEALYSNSTGQYNLALGKSALRSNRINSRSTAIGYQSMYYADNRTSGGRDTYNTALGYEALKGSSTASANTGRYNTAIGDQSMSSNTSGNINVSVGSSTMYSNTSGSKNVAFGHYALNKNTSGSNNVALGYYAGEDNISGNYNILIGDNVNALSGSSSNRLNIGNTIYGTGIYQSTYKIGIGVASPDEALDVRGNFQVKNSSGAAKTIIDGSSGNSVVEFRLSGSYGGAFGYNNTNDYLFMYHGGNVVLKNGLFGVGTTTPESTLQVGISGDGSSARANAWNTFSDERWKTNIEIISDPIEKLNSINGYYYNWKDGDDVSTQVGVIAQEIEVALPEIVSTDSDGYKSVDYSKIAALLIEVNKVQEKKIKELQEAVDSQNDKIDQLLQMASEK